MYGIICTVISISSALFVQMETFAGELLTHVKLLLTSWLNSMYVCCCYRCWVKRWGKDYSDHMCLTGVKIQYYFVLFYSGLHFFRVVNTKLWKMDIFEKLIGEETHHNTLRKGNKNYICLSKTNYC